MLDTKISTTLKPCIDENIRQLKERFFSEPQKNPDKNTFIEFTNEWFMSSKLNTINGIELFANKDIIIGCTQYIESNESKRFTFSNILLPIHVVHTLFPKE